jgi:DNA-binding NarL/FixJ family response regulator
MVNGAASLRRPIRLLIADDHLAPREGLRKLLGQDTGFLVVGEAADGKQALQQIARMHPEVVLIDIRMPVLDGIATTRIIRAEFPQVRVVGLSIGPNDNDVTAMRQAGATDCVDKGDWHAIAAAIRRCMEERLAA